MYPIETYFLAFYVDQLPRGVFHYRPDTHELEHLWELPPEQTPTSFIAEEWNNAAGLFIFTALWARSAQKYRDFTYNLALFEAGHLCQNLLLVATALNVSTRPLAGFNDDTVTRLLDLDTRNEQAIYAAGVGLTK